MAKTEYHHPTNKLVCLSAPKNQLETYKKWLDFCLTNYPLQELNSLDVRFQKRDHYKNITARGYHLYGGTFQCKYRGTGDIGVCLGKTFTSPEEEVRFIFFHEYGHCLQRDQGRTWSVTYDENETDADNFAHKAIKEFEHMAIGGIEEALAQAESALWRIPPNVHTVSLKGTPPDPFEGVGETYHDAYHRVEAELKSLQQQLAAALSKAEKQKAAARDWMGIARAERNLVEQLRAEITVLQSKNMGDTP
jgi:hypothetical protein